MLRERVSTVPSDGLIATAKLDVLGRPLLPAPWETSVVTETNPKIAAIFFDRVWCLPTLDYRYDIPDNVRFYGASDFEVILAAGIDKELGPFIDVHQEPYDSFLTSLGLPPVETDLPKCLRAIVSMIQSTHGISTVPMYKSLSDSLEQYTIGDRRALIASLENLEVIDESMLSWAQVSQLREDEEAKRKIRTLRHWLDREMVGKPIPFVTDAIGEKLESYKRSLRKHGIRTVTGSIKSILDFKFLVPTTAATAITGLGIGPDWAAALAAIVVTGKVAVTATEKFLDFDEVRNGDGAEVAFIHDLEKLRAKRQ